MHEGVFKHPAMVYLATTRERKEYLAIVVSLKEPTCLKPNHPPLRKAPYAHWLKANYDASMDTHAKKIGIGIVIRDNHGSVLVALSKPISF